MPTFEELQAGSVDAFLKLKETAASYYEEPTIEEVAAAIDDDLQRREEGDLNAGRPSDNIDHDSEFAKEVSDLPPAPKKKKKDDFTLEELNESIDNFFSDESGVVNAAEVINAFRLFMPDLDPESTLDQTSASFDRKERKLLIQRFARCSSRLTPKNQELVSPLGFFSYCAENGITLKDYSIMDREISGYKKHLKSLNK